MKLDLSPSGLGLSRAYIEGDRLLHMCVTEPLRRGTARVIAACERGVVIRDAPGALYVLSAADEETARALMETLDPASVGYLLLCDARHAPLTGRFRLRNAMSCRQAAYLRPEPPPLDSRLEIAVADDAAMRMIVPRYHIETSEMLFRLRDEGQLFFARDEAGRDVGFVGRHPEGCFGMLEVLEPMRGRGYGKALERFILRFIMERGETPYCQIEPDNAPSFRLQDALGLETHGQLMVFLWNGEEDA